jgi:predicted HTH domain antitoxin
MIVTLEIPDEILATLPAAPAERGARLLLELAASLYAKGTGSLAQGAAMAGMSRTDFGWELGERGIARHYGAEELAEDLAHASRQ